MCKGADMKRRESLLPQGKLVGRPLPEFHKYSEKMKKAPSRGKKKTLPLKGRRNQKPIRTEKQALKNGVEQNHLGNSSTKNPWGRGAERARQKRSGR